MQEHVKTIFLFTNNKFSSPLLETILKPITYLEYIKALSCYILLNETLNTTTFSLVFIFPFYVKNANVLQFCPIPVN